MNDGQQTTPTGKFTTGTEEFFSSDKQLSLCAASNDIALLPASEPKEVRKSEISDASQRKFCQLSSQPSYKTPILLPASSQCLQCFRSEMRRNSNSICAPCQFTNCHRKQIAQGRLSTEHWEQARRLLELPESFSKYSISKVGHSFNLINRMVKNLSAASKLSRTALAERVLRSHPTLSKKSRQKIRKIIFGRCFSENT